MRHLIMLLAAGALTLPTTGWAANASQFVYPLLATGVTDPTLNTTNPVGHGWSSTNGFGNDCPSCACGSHTHQYHPGIDISKSGAAGQRVYAVANGRVTRVANVMADPNDHSRGYYILIKHSLPQSETLTSFFLVGTTVPANFANTGEVTSAYLHVQNVRVVEDQVVSLGDWIGEVFDATTFGDHLHFEMRANWSTSLVSPEDCLGYYDTWQDITDFGYMNGLNFIGAHVSSTPPYRCQYSKQWVDGAEINEAFGQPGTTFTLRVDYWNTGTATWQNTGGTGNQNYVELRSVSYPSGNTTDSWFDPVNWISGRQRVVSCTQAAVPPSTSQTTGVATFTFQATIPSGMAVGSYPVYFRPFHGSTGLDDWGGMFWLVHVTGPTNPCAGAGSPCPGRYVPNSCLPGGTCCTPTSANIQTLPDLGMNLWESTGQPVRERLVSGTTYSIGFEYRAEAQSSLQLGFSSFGSATQLAAVASQAELPAAEDWKTFWSSPFTPTAEQLDRKGNLRLVSSTEGLTVRNVKIVAYPH